MVGEDLLNAEAVAFLGAMIIFVIIFVLAIYLYSSFAFMAIAKKTKTKNGWLAFIPIANIYLMTQIAGISGWWTLLVLAAGIPFLGSLTLTALMIYLLWLICEKVKRPGWWSLLFLIPIVNLVILGVLAWGKK